MKYAVGTQFRFLDNDFQNPQVTTPGQRTSSRRPVQEKYDGYEPGTRIFFRLVQSGLQIATIKQPKFATA